MANMKYVFGPVPSRRLGASLGISPIPEKTCNYSCGYCQLGRTNHMTNKRKEFFPLEDILAEFDQYLEEEGSFDIVSVVGEGEPTLYSRLGELILGLKARTDKPVAVITNGALLTDPAVRAELMHADLVLPSMDGYDTESFKKVDRPIGSLKYDEIHKGIVQFSHEFKGELWLEIMLVAGMNADEAALLKFKEQLADIEYSRLFLNTPVRPPAEENVQAISHEAMQQAVQILGGTSIDILASGAFHSEITDHFDAVLSIASRHPMNQFELASFLSSRGLNADEQAALLERLTQDTRVSILNYKGIVTYRAKKGSI